MKTIYILILIIVAFVIFGPPDVLNLGFVSWDFNDNTNDEKETSTVSKVQEIPTPPQVYAKDALKIENLQTKLVHSVGENVTATFTVKNDNNLQYNFTVYWINGDTRSEGWFRNGSYTEPFQTWYTVNKKGEWKIQVDLYWTYQDKVYSTDEVFEFSVY